MTAKEAGAAGYPPAAIRAAGYTTEEVAGALKEVMTAGLTASQAHAAGFSRAEMQLAGYSPDDLATTGNGATTAPGVAQERWSVIAQGQSSPKASPKKEGAKVNRHVTSVQVNRHPTVTPPPPDKTATKTASRNDNGEVKKRYFSFFPGRGKPSSGKSDAYSRATVDRLKRQNEQQQKELEKQQSEMRLLQEQVAAEPPSPPSHPPLHDCPCCSRRPSAPPPLRPSTPPPPKPLRPCCRRP